MQIETDSKIERDIDERIMRGVLIEKIVKARISFWEYEKLKDPKFFRDDRPYLKEMAESLQAVYEKNLYLPNGSVCRKIMINLPPRHGKSYTIQNFYEWALGRNPKERILSISYNETLSRIASKTVRNTINETRTQNWKIIYEMIFPETKIQYGDADRQLWSLEGSKLKNFLASSFQATLTGFGGTIGGIDDPIKNYVEAMNRDLLEQHVEWHNNTYLSRLEEGAMQIINMNRWSLYDLCGYHLELEPEEWFVIKYSVILKTGNNGDRPTMLCPDILSYETYQDKTKPGKMAPEIVCANYEQEPIEKAGRLYEQFRTYEPKELPMRFERIIAFVDTADEGDCYNCTVIAGELKKQLWLLDVLYDQDSMEKTEPRTAQMLNDNNVELAKFESNNGGRGFARSVERILREEHSNVSIAVRWFHQSENKIARILTGATYIQNHIFFPHDWMTRFPAFYASMSQYLRRGKNKYNDAPDAMTGLREMVNTNKRVAIVRL